MTLEPFVSAQKAAEFLGITKRFLLSLAREGLPGAYALNSKRTRRTWVFKLSEVSSGVDPKSGVDPQSPIKPIQKRPPERVSGYDPIRRFPLR